MSAPEAGGWVAAVLAAAGAVWATVRARVTMASVVEAIVAAWSAWRLRRGAVSPIEKGAFNVAKELGEVGRLACAVLEDFLDGKSWAEIAIGNGALLKEAMDGIRNIPDEFEADPGAVCSTIGVIVGRMVTIVLAWKRKRAAAGKVATNS